MVRIDQLLPTTVREGLLAANLPSLTNPFATIADLAGAGGVSTLSAIGAVPNANGATITGSTLNLQPASGAFGGVITTIAQTLGAGVKTFTSDAIISTLTIGRGTNSLATNTAIGVTALSSVTTGNQNVAVGYRVLLGNTSGVNNTAIGYRALETNTTNAGNTAIGGAALQNGLGANNIAIGVSAMESAGSSSSLSIAIGNSALTNNNGTKNIAIGNSTLFFVSTGTQNTAVGHQTGFSISTGSNNTIIGANVTGLAAALSNNIILADGAGVKRLQYDNTGALTLTGPAVTVVAATAPNRTITINVGGTVYFIHAKTTND